MFQMVGREMLFGVGAYAGLRSLEDREDNGLREKDECQVDS